MPKSIEIKKVEYEKDRLNNLVDTKIKELAPDTRFFINNIHDFFVYYNKIKGDIEKLEQEESHQSLLYNAISETEGEVIVWPINPSEDSDPVYTWNNINEMASKINDLQSKLAELQLNNTGLTMNVKALEESLESTAEQISNLSSEETTQGGTVQGGQINTDNDILSFGKITTSTPTKKIQIYNEGMDIDNILIEEESWFSAVAYYRNEDAGYIDISVTIKSDLNFGIHTGILKLSYPEITDNKEVSISVNKGTLYNFGQDGWDGFSHNYGELEESKAIIWQKKKNEKGSLYKNNILENGKEYTVELKYERRSNKTNWRGYIWIGGTNTVERITLPKGSYKKSQIRTFTSKAAGNNWDRIYLGIQNRKNNGNNVYGYFYYLKLWEKE